MIYSFSLQFGENYEKRNEDVFVIILSHLNFLIRDIIYSTKMKTESQLQCIKYHRSDI